MGIKKKILITVASLALVGGGFFVYNRLTDDTSTNSDAPTQEELNQMNAADNTPQTEKDTASDESDTDTSDQAPSDSADSSTNKQSVGVSISQASYDTDSEAVRVKAFAHALENGKCTLILSKSGQKTLSYPGNTEIQPSYTQCDPFDIPHTEFPVHGKWQVKVIYESATYRGEATDEVVLP